MAFHLNNKTSWGSAVVVAIITTAAAIWPVMPEAERQSFALLPGLLIAYLVLSSYLAFRLASWAASKKLKFGGTLAVLLSFLFLLAISWAVFGRYFYMSAVHGLLSVDQMTADFIIRTALRVQPVFVTLLSITCLKKSSAIDLIASILIAGALIVLAIG